MTERSATRAPAQWSLRSLQGPALDTGIPLSALPCVVGRRPGSGLFLADPSVSSQHAEFFERLGRLYVRDLGSTNGTFVNGLRTGPNRETPLALGDLVQFAHVVFRVDCDGPAKTRMTWSDSDVSLADWALTLSLFDKLMSERAVVPFYQPIVGDTAEGPQVVAYEVLGRSRLYGLDLPSEMFRAAAQLNQEAALSQMFRTAGMTVAAGAVLPHLFLNTHPAELRDLPRLIQSLREIRRLSPAQEVTLEIHESAIADVTTMKMLRLALNDLRMRLAYDDFGVGQARIVELAETAPDFVKFDMQLVRNIHQATPKQQQVLGSLVRMVNDLGIAPVAEGVESEDEAAVCRQIGFSLFQGYLFGRPAAASKYFKPKSALQLAAAH